jgi:hypothetical protein
VLLDDYERSAAGHAARCGGDGGGGGVHGGGVCFLR